MLTLLLLALCTIIDTKNIGFYSCPFHNMFSAIIDEIENVINQSLLSSSNLSILMNCEKIKKTQLKIL